MFKTLARAVGRLVLALGAIWLVAATLWLVLPSTAPSDARVAELLAGGKTVTRVFSTSAWLWPTAPRHTSFTISLARDESDAVDALVLADQRIAFSTLDSAREVTVWGRCGVPLPPWMPALSTADSVLLYSVATESKCPARLVVEVNGSTVEVYPASRAPNQPGRPKVHHPVKTKLPQPLLSLRLEATEDGQPEITFARGSASPSVFYYVRFPLVFILMAPRFSVDIFNFIVKAAIFLLGGMLHLVGIVASGACVVMFCGACYLAAKGRLWASLSAGSTAFMSAARGPPKLPGEEAALQVDRAKVDEDLESQ